MRRVPVASFWNCPIYPILDSCLLTVQYSFWQRKYRIYWMITWGKSAFVIGQSVYSGLYIYIYFYTTAWHLDTYPWWSYFNVCKYYITFSNMLINSSTNIFSILRDINLMYSSAIIALWHVKIAINFCIWKLWIKHMKTSLKWALSSIFLTCITNRPQRNVLGHPKKHAGPYKLIDVITVHGDYPLHVPSTNIHHHSQQILYQPIT